MTIDPARAPGPLPAELVVALSRRGRSLAQRQLEELRQPHDHVAARARAPRFDEAEVSRRDTGLAGQLEVTGEL